MWCVADLVEDYIAKMEDVLEMYARPTIPSNRWSFGAEMAAAVWDRFTVHHRVLTEAAQYR